MENSKGVTEFLAGTRHTSLHGSEPFREAGFCLENAVKTSRWELFLKAVMRKIREAEGGG